MTLRPIDIVGADRNNLRNIDLRLPAHSVTLISGVSGSGKSSLIDGTLAAESAARLETFLGIGSQGASDVRAYVGALPPTTHIGQQAFRASSRTTVGTSAGILRTLRRLFLGAAPHSERTGKPVPKPSAEVYASWIARHVRGRAIVSAVVVDWKATDGVRAVRRLSKLAIPEVIVRSETDSPRVQKTGRKVSLSSFRPLNPAHQHLVEAYLGSTTTTSEQELGTLLEMAFEVAERVVVELPESGLAELETERGICLDSPKHWVEPTDPAVYAPPSPHLLTFNAPSHEQSGACKFCQGLGIARTLDESKLVDKPNSSMHDGALALWTAKNYRYVNIQHETIEGLRGIEGFDPDVPWRKLPDSARRLILEGCDAPVVDRDRATGRKASAPRRFHGFRRAVADRVLRGGRQAKYLSDLVHEGACPACGGTRWASQTRALVIGGQRIHELLDMPLTTLATASARSGAWARALRPNERRHLLALHQQAAGLVQLGLGHLAAARGMLSLSEGESRRTRLAGVLTTDLRDLLIILDEPARGLHDEDIETLAAALARLTQRHSVVVSEHRTAILPYVSTIVELGPGGGDKGGRILDEPAIQRSVKMQEAGPETRRPIKTAIEIRGASLHNIHNLSCKIPLGARTCITGLSGSGKSNFLRGVLVPAAAGALPANSIHVDDFTMRAGTWTSFKGADKLSALIALDQKAPAANRRSFAFTLLDLAEPLRSGFASTSAARRLALGPSDFGLNKGDGRCTHCLGLGEIQDGGVWLPCPTCGGRRFSQAVLSVELDGWSIADLLDTSVNRLLSERLAVLEPHTRTLEAVAALGIGHLALGRSIATLSGGEIQRLRIAKTLAHHHDGHALFVLDEPAAGLHPLDIKKLEAALERILDGGRNTVVLVEHNRELIGSADHIIEFGPGIGPAGGKIIAEGPPSKVAKARTPTGRLLEPSRRHPTRKPSGSYRSSGQQAGGEQPEHARQWLRWLLGHDVDLPEPLEDGELGAPAADIGRLVCNDPRPWEIGGIDHELVRFLLDSTIAAPSEVREFAKCWLDSAGVLHIHPALLEIREWGLRLPRSAQSALQQRVETMGLELLDSPDPRRIRARGGSLFPRSESLEDRVRTVENALALGGGYVELVGPRGRITLTLRRRLMNLDQGIIGPLRPTSHDFVRTDERGRCPTCAGRGHVQAFDLTLIMGRASTPPGDERWLGPQALKALRGVRRNVLLPFLRRLEAEGLWSGKTGYQQLSRPDQDLLLFGYWRRPGHGTFLKKGGDPQEVGSWLKWDGLYRHLREQLERSTDLKWREQVQRSTHDAACPACHETGLGPAGELLFLAGRPLREWLRVGSLSSFLVALRKARPGKGSPARMRARWERLLRCLAPGEKSRVSLHRPAPAPLSHAIAEAVVAEMAQMRLLSGA